MSNLHIKNAAIISDGTRDDNRELWITVGVFTEKIPGVEYETIDAEGLYALPGFIDTHIHGFGGKGTEDGDKNSILKMSEILAKTGVTSFFPTIYTDTQERIIRDIKACTEASGEEKGASIAGIHVEGPFISPDRIGAQNPLGRLSPSKDDFMNMLNAGKGLIKAMTMASELDGIEEIAKLAIRNCDGVIINGDNIPQEIIEYAESLGKPIMPRCSEEEYATACNNFYDKIME